MASMCEAAIEAGITEIGFTEHLDYHPQDECTGYFQPDPWWEEIQRCQSKYADSLIIKAGLEISEPHRYPDKVRDILQNYDWDYTLGSLHWIGDSNIFKEDFYQRTKEETYHEYFQELEQMVDQGEFHILAHMDLVKRYGVEHFGPFHPNEFEILIRRVLRTMARRDLALEINTIPLRRPIKETSPSSQILKWFHEEGGRRVTMGSDAHAPGEISANLNDAVTIIRDTGFDSLTYFSKGKGSQQLLDDLRS
jgi:histidinol-phosphatase (PHP family)